MIISSNGKNIIKGILVFLFFWFSAYIGLYLLSFTPFKIKSNNKTSIIIYNLICDVVISIVLLFIYRKDLNKEFKIFKKNLIENLDIGLQCWFGGVFIMMVSNYILNVWLHAGGANNENVVRSMIEVLPIAMIINTGIIAPFKEEIVFRKTIKDVVKNKWLFVFLSFILFGGAHVIVNAKTFTDYLFIIPYGALGGAFALAYYKTNTIFTSMFYHMLHNFSLTLILILM